MLKRVRNKKVNQDKSTSKNCTICGNAYLRSTFQSWKEWNRSKYCSRACYWKTVSASMKGRSHPCKRKGTGNGWIHRATGYRALSHPDTGKKILEHRYVMEQFIGRKLIKNEQVHHLNGIKTDNRIENLSLTSQVDHMKLHTANRCMSMNKNKKMKTCLDCGKRFFSNPCKCVQKATVSILE